MDQPIDIRGEARLDSFAVGQLGVDHDDAGEVGVFAASESEVRLALVKGDGVRSS